MYNIERLIDRGRTLVTAKRSMYSDYVVSLPRCHEVALIAAAKALTEDKYLASDLAEMMLTSAVLISGKGSSLIQAMNQLEQNAANYLAVDAAFGICPDGFIERGLDLEDQLNDFYRGQMDKDNPELIPTDLLSVIDNWGVRYENILKRIKNVEIDPPKHVAYGTDGVIYHNPEITYRQAEDYECVEMFLNDLDAPTVDVDNQTLSMVGRIKAMLDEYGILKEDSQFDSKPYFKRYCSDLTSSGIKEGFIEGVKTPIVTVLEAKDNWDVDSFIALVSKTAHRLTQHFNEAAIQVAYRYQDQAVSGILDYISPNKPDWSWAAVDLSISSKIYQDLTIFKEWLKETMMIEGLFDTQTNQIPKRFYVRLYCCEDPELLPVVGVKQIPMKTKWIEASEVSSKGPLLQKIDYLIEHYESTWEQILRDNDSFEGALEAMTRPILLGVQPVPMDVEPGEWSPIPKEIRLTSEEAEAIIRRMRG